MMSGCVHSLSLPAKCPPPRRKAGSTHAGGRRERNIKWKHLFQTLSQFQGIIGRYFKDADQRILEKNVMIQLATSVWHDLWPFWRINILMVAVGEVASLVFDQSFASRNRDSLVLFNKKRTQTSWSSPDWENRPGSPESSEPLWRRSLAKTS